MENLELTLPSGRIATIRMQNGADDDILTNVKLRQSGEAFNRFLEGIIISLDGHKPSSKEILEMRLADKYALLINSRIFSLGEILKFEYNWPGIGKVTYEEDLNNYIWDYSKPDTFPADESDPQYSKYRIKPFQVAEEGKFDYNYLYFTLGEKNFRMRFSDGVFEKNLLKLSPDQLSNNSVYRARELAQQVGTEWALVDSFKSFTPMEMTKLRAIIHTYDEEEGLIVEIPHPETGEITEIPLMEIPDFLSPRVI